jgi:hypothetical protein
MKAIFNPKEKLKNKLKLVEDNFFFPNGKSLIENIIDIRASIYFDRQSPEFIKMMTDKGNLIKEYLIKHTDLSDIKIGDVIIKNFNFRKANLKGASFETKYEMESRSYLDGCNFSKSNLNGTDFTGSSLINTIFARNDLSNAEFDGCNLTGSNLLEVITPNMNKFSRTKMISSIVTKGTFEQTPDKMKRQIQRNGQECETEGIEGKETMRAFPFGYLGNSLDTLMVLAAAFYGKDKEPAKKSKGHVVNKPCVFNYMPKELFDNFRDKILATGPSENYAKRFQDQQTKQIKGKS